MYCHLLGPQEANIALELVKRRVLAVWNQVDGQAVLHPGKSMQVSPWGPRIAAAVASSRSVCASRLCMMVSGGLQKARAAHPIVPGEGIEAPVNGEAILGGSQHAAGHLSQRAAKSLVIGRRAGSVSSHRRALSVGGREGGRGLGT